MDNSGKALEITSHTRDVSPGRFKSNFRATQRGAWVLNASTLAGEEAFRVPAAQAGLNPGRFETC
jgi:hypothetical protein